MVIGDRFPAVLEAARAGDEAALTTIYRDLAGPVFGYLRGQGARDPEDLASEVFVGLVRGIDGFEGNEHAFRSWVFTIAHRRLLDERRRLARRDDRPLEQADAEAVEGGDAEDEAVAALAGSRLLGHLDDLTPDQRSVLLLRIVADLPVAEVAGILGKAPGAVKTLQRRALASLARILSSEAVS
jgi:RNA polymerase sigma factor (sigma-70 family)